jgi:hypothetical protein
MSTSIKEKGNIYIRKPFLLVGKVDAIRM